MRVNVIYEENLQIPVEKAFDLTMQWLSSQHKAKIKVSTPPKFIDAKQGTMMTNTGHDPNWKKRIRISFYDLEGKNTLVRVEATPLSRNILRVEKLKQSWYDGLFSHLFSLLQSVELKGKPEGVVEVNYNQYPAIKYCPNCGKKIEKKTLICSACGIEID
ncbi:MAG: zinc-ribbon domain-containing protein [Promethearchaeota archaeon]|jgi:transposase